MPVVGSSADYLFDLTLSEEQRLTRDSLKRFATAEMRGVARAADKEGAPPEGFYDSTLELGLALMPLPGDLGGAGMGRAPMANALNAEYLAEGDMALALGALAPLSFVNVLLDFATDEQQRQYLPRFSQGFTRAGIALAEPRARFDPARLETRARRKGNDYRLSGVKCMVVFGASADLLLVVAALEDDTPAAFIVEPPARGLGVARQATMGLRALELARVELDEVQVPASARVGDGADFSLERLVDLGRIGAAALSVGMAQGLLEYVVEYCNDRVAFGEPITNRQAVAFMVADLATELEALRLLTWRAAARVERGLPFRKEATQAWVFAAERGMKMATDGVQLLGGHGFTHEHPVELWYRNMRALGILEGICIL